MASSRAQPAGSKAEAILQNWLDTHGISYDPQFIVHRTPGFANRYRRGDVYLFQLRTVVLVDGSPFHRNPEERAAEEMFYRANQIFVVRIPAEELEIAAEDEDVTRVINRYLPALVYGISETSGIEPTFTPNYGKGRFQIRPLRFYKDKRK